MLVLHERHQVHVVLAPDDEDALAGVTVGIRVFQDVEQVATFDVEDDVRPVETASLADLQCARIALRVSRNLVHVVRKENGLHFA